MAIPTEHEAYWDNLTRKVAAARALPKEYEAYWENKYDTDVRKRYSPGRVARILSVFSAEERGRIASNADTLARVRAERTAELKPQDLGVSY